MLTFKLHALNTQDSLDNVLDLIEQSDQIDLLLLGPQLEAKLNSNLLPEEKSELLITLINSYFSDGFQDKFIGFAEQLAQHSKQYNLQEEAQIAALFLLPRQMNIRFRTKEFYEKLLSLKEKLDNDLDERVLYQIDIMLTTLNPSSFKFSQQQALMNHITRIQETGKHKLYNYFFYKALATLHSQIDLILHYSKEMLLFAQTHHLPINRNIMLHSIGYTFHFRRMTKESRKCIELQLKIAHKINDPLYIFRAQTRELEQLDQEHDYHAMLELISRINSGDYQPSQHWRNFVDYYEAVAQAYTGQVDLAQATYERLFDFLNSPELQRHNLPDYLNAQILFNQKQFEASKHAMEDYWWHRYNYVLQQQEKHVDEIRNQFLTLVNEKTDSIELANQRLQTFQWFIALLLVLISVIVFLIIRTKNFAKKLAAQHQKLEQVSRIDDLTKLLNRRYFLYLLNEELTDYRKSSHTQTCLLMIDIDHFKAINDNHGHVSGDLALEKVAQVIKKQSSKTTLCARYGGEEFLLLLRDTNTEVAFKFAEELRIAIQSTEIIFQEHIINITCSIGIAAYNNTAKHHDWIQNADKAMYQSKRKGRNQTTIFQEDLTNR
jgi:diguanylate cyclase (GGDEF)-like protein